MSIQPTVALTAAEAEYLKELIFNDIGVLEAASADSTLCRDALVTARSVAQKVCAAFPYRVPAPTAARARAKEEAAGEAEERR